MQKVVLLHHYPLLEFGREVLLFSDTKVNISNYLKAKRV